MKAAIYRFKQLFIKNTGLREVVKVIYVSWVLPSVRRWKNIGGAHWTLGWSVEPLFESLVNGGRNYNGPKVAKFLVG